MHRADGGQALLASSLRPLAYARRSCTTLDVSMDLRGISNIFVKLAGAVIVVWAVLSMSRGTIAAIQMRSEDVSLWAIAVGAALPSFIPLIAGVLLIYFPSSVTNRVLGSDEELNVSSLVLSRIEAIGYSVLGAYLVVVAVTDSLYLYGRMRLFYKYVENQSLQYMPPITPDDFAFILGTLGKFVLGIGLILGARGLATLFQRMRGRAGD